MSKYDSAWYKIYNAIAILPSKIYWRKQGLITAEQKQEIVQQLASGYYVILTGSRSHLSSVIVSLLSWIKTGVWARYSHVLMNCDNITSPQDIDSFKFMEATANGAHYSLSLIHI